MLIFVQVCKTIDKNLMSLWSIGSGRTNESNGINKKEAWNIWRKEVLKTSGSEEAGVIRSTSSEAGHQKLTSSEASEDHQELKIIRSWKTEELQNVAQMKIKSRLSLQKIGRIKQRLFQMDLKALDAYSVESVEKWLLYEVYNHYLHYSIFVSASTRTTAVPATVFL